MTTISRVKSAFHFGNSVQQLPEWNISIDTLSAADRQIAERWVNGVGAEVFARIVLSVAATKSKGRAAQPGEYMLIEAASILCRNPGMERGAAAGNVARRVVEEGDWRGRPAIGEAGLSSWIQSRLKRRSDAMERQANRRAAALRTATTSA